MCVTLVYKRKYIFCSLDEKITFSITIFLLVCCCELNEVIKMFPWCTAADSAGAVLVEVTMTVTVVTGAYAIR